MRAVLVDTSVWYGALDPGDSRHQCAVQLLNNEPLPRIITQPCLVELITLLASRTDPAYAARMCRDFRAGLDAHVADPSAADEAEGLRYMEKFANLRLSYADATACALVRRLDIPRVLSFDLDFRIVLTERDVIGPA